MKTLQQYVNERKYDFAIGTWVADTDGNKYTFEGLDEEDEDRQTVLLRQNGTGTVIRQVSPFLESALGQPVGV